MKPIVNREVTMVLRIMRELRWVMSIMIVMILSGSLTRVTEINAMRKQLAFRRVELEESLTIRQNRFGIFNFSALFRIGRRAFKSQEIHRRRVKLHMKMRILKCNKQCGDAMNVSRMSRSGFRVLNIEMLVVIGVLSVIRCHGYD